MERFVFEACALAVSAFYGVAVSDVRSKPGMMQVMPTLWVALEKTLAVIAFGIYLFILVSRVADPTWLDWIGLAISAVGTTILVKAKMDLASSHCWVGYFRKGVSLIREGVYSRLRNPMYVGIFLFMSGTLSTQFEHGPLGLVALNCALCLYIWAFLFACARKERALLQAEYGAEWEDYAARTAAAIPGLR
jgi:protein-S-isoprenylcysteine O-methyltransferase Ste14